MSHNQMGRKIGIYKELAVGILVSVAIAAAVAMGVFYICKSRGILIEVEEDCSQYKKKCDLQVMELVRELDSALNTAMEEIESTESQEENITDAMRYLMQNDKMPFVSVDDGENMSITIASKKGTVLWKNNSDDETMPKKGGHIEVDELGSDSYDEECGEYIFVYTKSVEKVLYYIVFRTPAYPEYIYHDMQLRAACLALAAVLFLILVLIFSKSRISYIRYLSGVVDEISKGNLHTRIDKKGYDELTTIAESIDDMQHNLDKMMKEERENERKNRELITNLSHDIKTPMTIITGYLDVVISGKYEDESERDLYIKKAFAQVEKINGMIQKIFLLAKNEIKVEQDNTVRCNLSMMVSQDVSEFEGIAQKQNRNFVTDIPEKPLYANIVIEDMREVLDNILMNAIKYSKPETDIMVSMEEEESTMHLIVRNVSEEVKEADCTRIFDKFYRADHARGSNIAGNGLGLSIVRETVERSKGKVWAEYAQGYFSLHIRLLKA